jgi:hypothetical protein
MNKEWLEKIRSNEESQRSCQDIYGTLRNHLPEWKRKRLDEQVKNAALGYNSTKIDKVLEEHLLTFFQIKDFKEISKYCANHINRKEGTYVAAQFHENESKLFLYQGSPQIVDTSLEHTYNNERVFAIFEGKTRMTRTLIKEGALGHLISKHESFIYSKPKIEIYQKEVKRFPRETYNRQTPMERADEIWNDRKMHDPSDGDG